MARIKVFLTVIFVIIILVPIAFYITKNNKTYTPPTNPTHKNYEIFEKYSNGACSTNSDCVPSGCSSHICSSDPGLITTCEAISDHPKTVSYSCGCVNQTCVWYK